MGNFEYTVPTIQLSEVKELQSDYVTASSPNPQQIIQQLLKSDDREVFVYLNKLSPEETTRLMNASSERDWNHLTAIYDQQHKTLSSRSVSAPSFTMMDEIRDLSEVDLTPIDGGNKKKPGRITQFIGRSLDGIDRWDKRRQLVRKQQNEIHQKNRTAAEFQSYKNDWLNTLDALSHHLDFFHPAVIDFQKCAEKLPDKFAEVDDDAKGTLELVPLRPILTQSIYAMERLKRPLNEKDEREDSILVYLNTLDNVYQQLKVDSTYTELRTYFEELMDYDDSDSVVLEYRDKVLDAIKWRTLDIYVSVWREGNDMDGSEEYLEKRGGSISLYHLPYDQESAVGEALAWCRRNIVLEQEEIPQEKGVWKFFGLK